MPISAQQQVAILEKRFGVVHMERIQGSLNREAYGGDYSLAMDAQPELVTVSNAGIPAYLANYLDPEVTRVLVTPTLAAEIYGETKKGSWVTLTAQFRLAESTGNVSSYGDYSNNGQSGTNSNWVPRESYHFQTITRWGERELDIAAEGRIDLASDLNIASALIINKAHNAIGFLGVASLTNYGALNDPSLPTAISPLPAVAPSTGLPWADKDAAGIYADCQALYTQLVTQLPGLVNRRTPMVMAMSVQSEAELTKTNQYNVNVSDQLKKNFPNLEVRSAPEFATQSGNLVQLFVPVLEGQRTVEICFTEKMRAHPVKVGMSNFKQKKSGGSWGAIWKRPVACAQMLGV